MTVYAIAPCPGCNEPGGARYGDDDLCWTCHQNGTRAVEPEPELPAVVEPVDTTEMLEAVGKLVRRFVVLPSSSAYLAVALFVMHTWAFKAAHATPYLVVESPEKQSGKTRLLEVLEMVCHNPLKVASITAAALFQSVAGHQPTLLIDEADAIFGGNSERNEDLRGVLNAGNLPGSPVIRGGKNGKPVRYDVFCPKVIAGIATGKLPDTIRDRAIINPMDRKLRSEKVERLRRHRIQGELDSLRSRLAAWADQNHNALFEYDLPEPMEKISDRLEEAWEPLLAIADLAGGGYPAKARAAAEGLAPDGDEDAAASHVLLLALRDVFGSSDKMSTRQIIVALNENEELPYGSWNDGNGIRPTGISRSLRRYRIKPKKVRVGETVLQGYHREQFESAWGRYGADLPGTPGTTPANTGDSGGSESGTNAECSGFENGENPRAVRDVPDVPSRNGHLPEAAPEDEVPDWSDEELQDLIDRS